MYIAILFSFALVLILFAGLTQNNVAKEMAESNNIKQNYVEISEQYQTLSDSMRVMTKELESAHETIEKYEKDISEKASQILATEKLIRAMKMHDLGKRTEAKEIISELDKQTLTESQLYIYNKINK